MENPFVLMIYNKDFEFQGYLGNPINLAVTPRFNETGTATVEIDLDHRLAPAILAEGSRIVISKDGTFVLSGRIYQKNAEGPAVKGTLKFFVKSDFRTMHQVLGWPLPGSALADQGNGAYDITGNAEAALKTIVQANMVSRLGLPITVAASAGRGATLPAE
jgi:predicted house-cleaning NTP pyrophosphatase (Maf/HAM1 superfamily)